MLAEERAMFRALTEEIETLEYTNQRLTSMLECAIARLRQEESTIIFTWNVCPKCKDTGKSVGFTEEKLVEACRTFESRVLSLLDDEETVDSVAKSLNNAWEYLTESEKRRCIIQARAALQVVKQKIRGI